MLFGFLLADNKCKKKPPKPKKTIVELLLSEFCITNFANPSSFSTAIYQKTNPNTRFNKNRIEIRKTPKDCQVLQTDCNSKLGKFQRHGDITYDDFYCICLY
tara:strand:+ start:414 stop:719 length:306 start_codon:yes stop_codon:yes gene_type:complete